MTTTSPETLEHPSTLDVDPITKRSQFLYVTTIADVAAFAQLEGTELYAHKENSKRSVAKITNGGIELRGKHYKLPQTAAIAYETLYGERWSPLDGWKYWDIIRNDERISLADLREEYLQARIDKGDVIQD